MNRTVTNPLIDSLTEDLTPTRPLDLRTGFAIAGVAAAVTAIAVEMIEGIGRAASVAVTSPLYLVVNGLLAVLAVAATVTVVRMVRPRVGNRHDAAKGAFAMLIVVPVAAVTSLFVQGGHEDLLADPYGVSCMVKGLAASVLMAGGLIYWLRRGAPVSLNAAGFYTGIAAGAAGSLLYGVSCPLTSVGHLGIWHMLPVVLCAAAGRVIVPSAIRW